MRASREAAGENFMMGKQDRAGDKVFLFKMYYIGISYVRVGELFAREKIQAFRKYY